MKSRRWARAALICPLFVGSVTGVALGPGTSDLAAAQGILHCAGNQASSAGTGDAGSAGLRQVDPVVQRGAPVSSHLHEFFGSTKLATMAHPENADYADLVGSATTCDDRLDSASYWIPLLSFTNGTAVPLYRMEAYYLAWNGKPTDPTSSTQPYAPDTRLVAGDAMAMSAGQLDLHNVNWSCGNFSTKSNRQHFRAATPAAADCSTASLLQPGRGKVVLSAALTFPSCWDGLLNDHTVPGNTADFTTNPASVVQHFAYPTGKSCPTGFPKKVPTLRMNISWSYAGNGKDVRLSSGAGYTLHADFLNSWNQSQLTKMVDLCINTTLTEQQVHQKYPKVCGAPIPTP